MYYFPSFSWDKIKEPVLSNEDSLWLGHLKSLIISGSIRDLLETLNQKFQIRIYNIWGKTRALCKRNSKISIGRSQNPKTSKLVFLFSTTFLFKPKTQVKCHFL